ncbi:MAG: oligosaccharide flippase family protein [Oscillospiraceae bacterium]|nr:oligosaccharide flippase family protein [Oscillospiraceae bacterium]
MKRTLLYNTALLTASSLLMSGISMAFQVWLVGRIGSAGIGLYQLVLSVTGLCATFAISGIRFASTRLVAEELGLDRPCGVRAVMSRCLAYGAFFGLAAAVILWELAGPIGVLWIGDARTVRSLRLSALSMPCVSLSSSMSGYFTACGRVWKPTLIHLIEQLATIALAAFFLGRVPAGSLEKSCAAVTLGRVAADVLSLVMMALAYLFDRRGHYAGERIAGQFTLRMLRIAGPLALSAYARSALTTLQHLLTPRGLKAAGYSANGALSGYGTIQGMVLPVIFFPSCITAAAAELIVPELTAAQVRRDRGEIRRTTRALLCLSALFSLAVGLFLFVCADALGMLIYDSREAGRYIRILAPLVPVMYTDMSVDGCLKGLGQQVWSMGVNILDALLGLLLTWQLLPRYALSAYIGIIYATELFNFALSAGRLRSVTRSLSPSARGAADGADPPYEAGAKCACRAGR